MPGGSEMDGARLGHGWLFQCFFLSILLNQMKPDEFEPQLLRKMKNLPRAIP